jgi:hypothetical protein
MENKYNRKKILLTIAILLLLFTGVLIIAINLLRDKDGCIPGYKYHVCLEKCDSAKSVCEHYGGKYHGLWPLGTCEQ